MKGRAKMVVVEQPFEGAPSMGKSITDLSPVTTVGLDLAKHVFQVHGIDASGATSCWSFLLRWPRALSGLKPAGRRIIGRAS
jgi:hypothetical protein